MCHGISRRLGGNACRGGALATRRRLALGTGAYALCAPLPDAGNASRACSVEHSNAVSPTVATRRACSFRQ